MSDSHDDEQPQTYDGALEMVAADGADPVTVGAHLAGFFQPIDGSFRWHGRTDPDDRVTDLAARVARKPIAVRVPGGDWAEANLAEQNPWGGYRIAGRGRPPFTVDRVEVDAAASRF